MRPKFNSETARAAGKICGPARARPLSPLSRSMIGAQAAQACGYPVHASHAERLEAIPIELTSARPMPIIVPPPAPTTKNDRARR
jgi:hypothetical protein